jgi:hypothetical protein
MEVRWSPDFDAYASGQLPIEAIRCVLCGLAPCQCLQCPAIYTRRFAAVTGADPAPRECGMTVGPDGKCPRGHYFPLDHCPGCAHRHGTGCGCPCCLCPSCRGTEITYSDRGGRMVAECQRCQVVWGASLD